MTRPKTTRREFTKKLALLASAPLAAAEATAAPAPPVDGPPRPAEAASVGQALAEVVRLRYGKHLSEEQLKRVRQRIEASLRSSNALRRPPLLNADEPDFVFFAEVL